MNKKKFLIIAFMIIILIMVVVIVSYVIPEEQGAKDLVIILTDKQEYESGENLRVKIENNTKERVCFSSCYPYYIQKMNGDKQWKDYQYEDCTNDNLVEDCVDSKNVKAFEFTVPRIDQGEHRLIIGACVGCNLRQSFERHKNLISNNFIIK